MFSSVANPPVSPGFSRGVQRITQRITMDRRAPDEFASEATVAFFDSAGTELVSACATAAGHRY